jgi:hypothetical protein
MARGRKDNRWTAVSVLFQAALAATFATIRPLSLSHNLARAARKKSLLALRAARITSSSSIATFIPLD